MTLAERLDNYETQRNIGWPGNEDSERLTGPQRRRLKHKRGHETAKARKARENG